MDLDWGSNCNSRDVNLHLWDKLVLAVVLGAAGLVRAAPQASCTTATVIDTDCDGYGVSSTLGPDADDSDPAVNTAASMIAKYDPVNRDPFAALQTFLPLRRGYHPLHYVFIAPNGEDSTCAANNINLPCATFAKANALAVAGDAVVWRAGTYSYTSPLSGKSGTPAHPMIYMAYPGEKAILSWKVASDGVSMDAQSYWIIDGLVITQTANLGAGIHYVQSNNVYGGTIVNTETIGWYDGAFLQNGLNNLTIQASAIHDSEGEHNVYVGCSNLRCPNLTVSGNLLYDTTGIHNLHLNGRFPSALIEGNTFYGAIGDCLALQMGVSGSTIQNNICHTVVSAAIWLIDYFETSDPSIGCYDQNYNLVRNNTFIDDGQSWNLTASGNDGSQPVYRVSDSCAQNPGTHDLGHNTFDSNIFIHWCSGNCPYGHGPVLMYDGPSGAGWLATDNWRNNILADVDAAGRIANVDNSDLSWSALASQMSSDSGNNIDGDPLFLAANPAWSMQPDMWNPDVEPQSPAAGLANSTDVPSTDILGNCRSARATAGAYEAMAASSCVPIGDVRSSASSVRGPVAPGEIVTIYGSGLGPKQLTPFNLDASGRLSSQLSGTAVLFNNIPAPIVYTSATQVAAIVPYAITGPVAQIVVQYEGQTVSTSTVALAPAVPGLYTADYTGTGQAAAINEDGSLNSISKPAAPGGVIALYATGGGQMQPSAVDGQIASSTPAVPILPVSVSIGGLQAQVQYAGGAPMQVNGLLQINAVIPADVTPGNAIPISVQIGSFLTPPGATIAVSAK